MTDEQKQKMIDKVIHDFDFEKVRALMLVMDWTWAGHGVPTEQKLWDKARKLCEKVMEHDDRECWWATTGDVVVNDREIRIPAERFLISDAVIESLFEV